MKQNLQILSTEFSELKDKFKLSDEKLILRFKEGSMNLDNRVINLIGDVEGTFNLDGKTFNLKTNGLRGNLIDKTISSKKSTLFKTEDIEIVSSEEQSSISHNSQLVYVWF